MFILSKVIQIIIFLIQLRLIWVWDNCIFFF
jgi:hypothetical protein